MSPRNGRTDQAEIRVRRVEGAPVVAVRLWICAGARREPIPGQALLTGRMLTEGTRTRDWRRIADDPEPYAPQDPAGFTAAASFYEVVGGHDTFERLVTRFYEGVAADPVLRPMYPEDTLDGARERLLLFLEQYWGGPSTYQETRGHPRLRSRHVPFRVDPDARDRWIGHMRVAVDSLDLAPLNAGTLMDYLERAAHFMVNSGEPTPPYP